MEANVEANVRRAFDQIEHAVHALEEAQSVLRPSAEAKPALAEALVRQAIDHAEDAGCALQRCADRAERGDG